MDNVSAVILAGGKSRRMGSNKALLELGKVNMVERIARELSRSFQEIILVAGEPGLYKNLDLRMVSDIYQGCGPLGGIHAALVESTGTHIFVTACDMPFVDAILARHLTRLAKNYDVVAPRLGQYIEPLFAAYSKDCIPAIERQFARGSCKITGFYNDVKVCYVDKNEIAPLANPDRVFLNVNTPDDLEQVKKLIKGEISKD